MLLHLSVHGPLSQSRLQELTGADKSTMVRTVDHLEGMGMVTRATAGGDRRAYAVEVTPAGAALFVEAEQVARTVADDLLDCLEPPERSQFRDLLRRFAAGRTPDRG